MMRQSLSSIFSRCWEKLLFLIALVICAVLLAIAMIYFHEAPTDNEHIGAKPGAKQLFPWSKGLNTLLIPDIPEVDKANPFLHTLINSTKVEPPKTPEKKVEKSTPVAPNPPAPQQPKPAEKIKPADTITIQYRAFYQGIHGENIALINIADSKSKANKNTQAKIGDSIQNILTIIDASPTQITILDAQGNTTEIPWNEKQVFHY